jgi:eukaryotic-like serine/threonine-protein kinase
VQVGDVVAGRYGLAEVLGTGGMARVYRAHDRVLERDVALKVLDERLSEDPEYVERFRREARAIARLSHPNIVTVIDRGETEGWQFIVFEHVRGPNLKQLVQRRGQLPVAQALTLAHQAARGLAFAHENGVVHRDVKPQNVLVDPDGVAKVTDFGIARAAGADQGLTMTGTILGTGDYLSPEQASGEPVDARSDQYSLGVLLFELLTGEPPYTGESLFAVAARHVNDPIPSVRERRPEVSERVEATIRRAMAKRPEDRFPTTDALIAALEACMAEDAGAARARRDADDGATQIIAPAPVAPRSREPRDRKSRRLPWALLAGLGVLAAAAAIVWALATERFIPGTGEAGGGGGPVRLVAVADYDPDGDDVEHPELLPAATDGDPETFWRTETYGSTGLEGLGKAGVGVIVDARRRRELNQFTVVTDTPGFVATIRGGDSPTGEFRDLADAREVGAETTFALSGGRFRYYLVWITDLDEVAHVNEVRAR